jgi:hypothetical protein
LLPPSFAQDFTAEEQRLILHHELMHLKRGDLPLNTLLCVLMALHWFNPLLWIAFLKVRADREAACDSQVLENASPARRSAYGHTLLKIESAFAPLRLSLGFIGILQRHASLRARIRSIAAPRRTGPLTSMLLTVCMAAMTFLGVTRAEKSMLPAAPAKLMGLTMKHIQFDPASAWDLGGRLTLPAPKAATDLTLDTLGEKELEQLVAQTLRQPGAKKIAWPRIAAAAGEKATIRSVLNEPVVSPMTGGIDHLQIGFTANFVLKPLEGGKVHLDVDITDSCIIGMEMVAGNPYPKVQTHSYKAPVKLAARSSAILYGWCAGERSKPVPVLIVLTPDEEEAGAAATRQAPHPPGKITSDEVVHDEAGGTSRHTGHVKLETLGSDGSPLRVTAEEMIYNKAEDTVTVMAPLEANHRGTRGSSADSGGRAVIEMKTGKFKLSGASFKTQMLSEAAPKKSVEEEQAAALRAAKAQQYDFAKAKLGDVLRYLANHAGINCIHLPDDHPTAEKLVSFSINGSPFAVLEKLCKAHGLTLEPDEGVWHIRPLDDEEKFIRLTR